LENFSHEVRLPSHVWTKVRKYNDSEQELSFVLGRAPTVAEIASEMDITFQEAVQIQQYRFETISLASPIGSPDGVNLTFGDTLIDYDAQIPGADYMDYAA